MENIGNVNSTWILFGIISGFGAFAGAAVYLLLTSNRYRRSEYSGRELSKNTAIIVMVAIIVLFIGMAYYMCWDRFYRIGVAENEIVLHYLYPARTIRISYNDLDQIYSGVYNPKTDDYELIIKTKNGAFYQSGVARRMYIEKFVNKYSNFP